MWYMYVLLFYAVIKLIGEKNAVEMAFNSIKICLYFSLLYIYPEQGIFSYL